MVGPIRNIYLSSKIHIWTNKDRLLKKGSEEYMQYNALGRTGLNVSRIGFGGGGIGQVWGETTRDEAISCLLYTSPSPRDLSTSRMPSSA